jgi:hypothetical protein
MNLEMLSLKNILIGWQISTIQQKIKRLQRKGQDIKLFRAQIAELNRKKRH